MPIYEYKCESCGKEQEISQKISDDALTTCPLCGKEALERLVSASSFALKGSGWYADGYGGAGKKAASDTSASPKPTKADVGTKAAPEKKKKASSGSSGSD